MGGRSRLVISGVALAVTIAGSVYFARGSQPLPYHDSFSSGRTGEWRAYGGNWETNSGAIRNLSEERGAKLMTGSSQWSDYSVEADIMLLGQGGDAGLIVRSSDEEDGVDSYSGYYAGLRQSSGVVIGRADHGWMEYQWVPTRKPLHPFKWYHLKIIAVGCDVAAVASDPETQENTITAMREKDCARTGRIGLRSYSSGGAWKNVVVVPADRAELVALELGAQVVDSPEEMQTEAGFSAALMRARQQRIERADAAEPGRPADTTHTPPLDSLRLLSELHPPRVTVRGNVVLTSPTLYIQDATGGLAISRREGGSLKLGDEVEASGTVEQRGFTAILNEAKVRLLWSREPVPPLSVTAAQAASGAFDGMFIEIEGNLQAQPEVTTQSVVMDLRSGQHGYRAILSAVRQEAIFDKLQPKSLLRLRGVCVVDAEQTKNLTPFVLFVRSSGDVAVVSGPPWWDVRHLGEIALALVTLTFVGMFIYTRVERWRMRAVVEERSRMAREIHDTLAQGFAGIALQLQSVLRKPWAKDVEIGSVAVALRMAQQSRREAHRSIAALRTLHTDEPLENMLRKLLRSQAATKQVELYVSRTGTPQRLSAECGGHVLRIAQEALANAMQHGAPARIEVHLEFGHDKLRLEVCDDGQGFDVSAVVRAEEGHFGIVGMRERAAQIRGGLDIQSGSNGTRVILTVPLCGRKLPIWKPRLWWTRALLRVHSAALNRN
jgi:signal transduction histidine kinase